MWLSGGSWLCLTVADRAQITVLWQACFPATSCVQRFAGLLCRRLFAVNPVALENTIVCREPWSLVSCCPAEQVTVGVLLTIYRAKVYLQAC